MRHERQPTFFSPFDWLVICCWGRHKTYQIYKSLRDLNRRIKKYPPPRHTKLWFLSHSRNLLSECFETVYYRKTYWAINTKHFGENASETNTKPFRKTLNLQLNLLLSVAAYNAHLRGKIELAKIGERSEQNSQLYFVPL